MNLKKIYKDANWLCSTFTLQMIKALHVTNVGKYLLTKATLNDISSMFVLTIQAEHGNAHIVGKLSSILAI